MSWNLWLNRIGQLFLLPPELAPYRSYVCRAHMLANMEGESMPDALHPDAGEGC